MPTPVSFLSFVAMGSPIALNALLPALPAITGHFGVNASYVQLSFSLYLAALAIGQLLVGGIISSIGLRRTLFLGLASFILGGALGFTHLSLDALLTGRVMQGLGGAVMMSVARALLVGQYGKEKAPQKMGYLIMAIALSQSIAPLLGSYIQSWSGWASIFLFSSVQGMLLLLLSLKFVQKDKKHQKRLSIQETLALYKTLLLTADFRMYAVANTLIACCFYLFVSSAPYLTANFEGTEHEFGYWFVSISLAFMLGGYLSTQLNKRLAVDKTIILGNGLSLFGAITLLATQLTLPQSYAGLFLPMCFITLGRGISQPSYQSAGLSTAMKQSGMAAGLMGFLQLTSGAITSQLTPSLIAFWQPLLPICILGCVVMASLMHFKAYTMADNRN